MATEIKLATARSEAECGCDLTHWYGDKRVYCPNHGWVASYKPDDMTRTTQPLTTQQSHAQAHMDNGGVCPWMPDTCNVGVNRS